MTISPKVKTILIAAVLVVLVGLVGLVFIGRIGLPREVLTKWGRILPTPLPTPTPTPKPIPSGKQSFTVISGKKTGPQFLKGEINPYDPKRGSHQLLTVTVKSEKPVAKASLTMTTDTKARTLPLELKEGSPNDGLWTATWVVDDTYLYTYLARFWATDGTEENSVELTLR